MHKNFEKPGLEYVGDEQELVDRQHLGGVVVRKVADIGDYITAANNVWREAERELDMRAIKNG